MLPIISDIYNKFGGEWHEFIQGFALETLLMPNDPSKRIYWLFVVTSCLLALLTLYLQKQPITLRALQSAFFSRKYWFHRSSITDMLFLTGNAIYKTLVLVPLFGVKLFAAIIVARFLQAQFDTPSESSLSALQVTLLYSFIFFIIEDFSRFILHFAMHKVPLLWELHKVHHSATVLTPLTLYRIHPIEMTLYYARSFLVFGVVTGSFIYLFGGKVNALDIMGVHAAGFIFNTFGANLRHSHIWLSFGFFEKFFISPAQHQIHHSRAKAHHDKNFGTCLAFWDQLFGSWVKAGKVKKLRFGLSPNFLASKTGVDKPKPVQTSKASVLQSGN